MDDGMVLGKIHSTVNQHSQLYTKLDVSIIRKIRKEHTLWWTNKKLLKMAIEIVDFPIKNGDFPLLC